MRNLPRFSIGFFALVLLTAVVTCSGVASAQQLILRASSTSLSFGSLLNLNSKQMSETLTNAGRTNVKISSAKISESGTAFSLSGLPLPTTIAPGHSYTFKVTFTPKGSGTKTGTLAVVSNAPRVAIALKGTGIQRGTLAVTPANMNFGSVAVHSGKTVKGTLTASTHDIVVSSAGTNSSEYTMSGITLPLTIKVGHSATFTMTFKPQSKGAATAKASFKSNAHNSSLAEALAGTGTSSGGSGSTPDHSVSLSWRASTSSVAGYYIYRSTVSGGPYTKLNSSRETATVYTDSSVKAGATYYYVTTAVNSKGTESEASNQVKAKIPTP
jgi:hypothetical protein